MHSSNTIIVTTANGTEKRKGINPQQNAPEYKDNDANKVRKSDNEIPSMYESALRFSEYRSSAWINFNPTRTENINCKRDMDNEGNAFGVNPTRPEKKNKGALIR